MAKLIDGKARAAALRVEIAEKTAQFKKRFGRAPGLAVVIVGEDPASQVYVRNKIRQTAEVGMEGRHIELPADTSEAALLEEITALNADPAVDGILVQLPLPSHIDASRVIGTIDPEKDVDGFHIRNAGLLMTGEGGMVPCTPKGCMLLLTEELGDLSGLHALVVGRSNIVGKPMAHLLLDANATVTIAHSRTRNLAQLVGEADILVAAVGVPCLIKGVWIKPGATVIDVGINRVENSEGKSVLRGDVEFEAAAQRAGAITPVPGGVGPMTIACLLANTLEAAEHRQQHERNE